MIGLEIQSEGAPAPDLRDRIIERAFHQGLLLLPCGPSTIRFCPPLCLTRRQVEIGLALFGAAFDLSGRRDASGDGVESRNLQSRGH
jgi:4-aminobutyrate aminotransferase